VGELALLRSEEARVARVVGENEVEAKAAEDGEGSLNDEEPPPAGDATGAVKTSDNGASHDATEGGCNAARGIEDTQTLSCSLDKGVKISQEHRLVMGEPGQSERHTDFTLGVPASEEEDGSREETGLYRAQEEASDDEALKLLCLRHGQDDSAPNPDDGGEVDGRAHLVHDHVGRHFCEEISDKEEVDEQRVF
jgi:hypothetical protein